MDKILGNSKFAFIGCGVMAESIIAGLLINKLVSPAQISGSHPRKTRRELLSEKYSIEMFQDNGIAIDNISGASDTIIVVCVKPQRLKSVLKSIERQVAADCLVISIVAGAKIEMFEKSLLTDKIVRAMPNTPSQIGEGITAWTASEAVSKHDLEIVSTFLSALGNELYVQNERMVDMATSLSATGPTYVFLLMEALTDAGVHLGFSRNISKELVQEMMLGSVKFAIESDKHPAELRNMVTSPGGTSASAIYEMEKGSLRTVMSKAVFAAYQRAEDLGNEELG